MTTQFHGMTQLPATGNKIAHPASIRTLAQLQRRELRAAKERESKRKYLSNADIRVLLEDLQKEGDVNEAMLLPKSREELLAELERRRNRNNATTNEPS